MKYAGLREEYKQSTLVESDLLDSPFALFEKWFDEAKSIDPKDANAMVLSTLGADGFPHGRVVLLKGVDSGFVWFTNYLSQKAQDLDLNHKASLTFWWPAVARQVRVTGIVGKIDDLESDEYFQSRPRGSQAGAIASIQSTKIEGRAGLENAYQQLMALPEDEAFERPKHWGGYRLIPQYFEFWQGRESRLHDRLYYELTNGQVWEMGRLSP